MVLSTGAETAKSLFDIAHSKYKNGMSKQKVD